jgi:hypothetical protein
VASAFASRSGVLGGRVDHWYRAAVPSAGPLPADQQASRYVDANQFGQVPAHCSILSAGPEVS